MERIAKEAFDNPEKGLEYLESGEFLIANNRRINVDDFEEVALHGKYAIEAWEKTLKGKGPESFNKWLTEGEEILKATTNEDLIAQAAMDHSLAKHLAARVVGYKMAAQSLGRDMMDKWLQIEVHGKTPELMAEFTKMSETYQTLSLTAKDIITSSARAIKSGQISPKYLDPEVMANILKATDGNPEKVAAILNASRAKHGFQGISEYVINGLLSSPKTHLVNITGNFLKTALMPAEKMLGGVMMGNPQMYREGIETFSGLTKFYRESWTAAKTAWKTGENALDAGHRVLDTVNRPIMTTYDKIRQDILNRKIASGNTSGQLSAFEELQARAFSFFGLPSRALGTMDEFFKQLNYRANVYAKLSGEASAKFGTDTNAMRDFIENGMRDAFDSAGRGTDSAALRYAQESTWTQALKDDAYFNGGFGQAMMNATNSYPPLKLVMPFIRTPTNLIRDFVAHTPPLAVTTKRFKDAMKAGGERQAHALGQIATGSLLWGSAITLAMQGKMTGGYPKDPATKQAWIDAGIEPYSFKVGDKYVSFARLDPFATFFGLAADYAEYSRNWSDSVKGNWASGAMLALAENILSKSYLTGLTDLIDALGDESVDSSRMQRFMNRSVTMFLPYSSGLRFARQANDDSMREVRGMWDSIYNAIPGTSHLLPEKRSWITGKPVSHNLFWGENKNDLVTNELARLGDNLSLGAPAKKLSGVELDAEQYSRLCELHGTVTIGGRTLHESLRRLMQSGRYDIDRQKMPDMPGDLENPRTMMVEQIVRQYRRKAQAQLKRERPELQEAIRSQLQARVAAKKGDAAKVQELLSKPK